MLQLHKKNKSVNRTADTNVPTLQTYKNQKLVKFLIMNP